jgi:hypothetical protein
LQRSPSASVPALARERKNSSSGPYEYSNAVTTRLLGKRARTSASAGEGVSMQHSLGLAARPVPLYLSRCSSRRRHPL